MALSFFPNHRSSYLLSSAAVRPRYVHFSFFFFFNLIFILYSFSLYIFFRRSFSGIPFLFFFSSSNNYYCPYSTLKYFLIKSRTCVLNEKCASSARRIISVSELYHHNTYCILHTANVSCGDRAPSLSKFVFHFCQPPPHKTLYIYLIRNSMPIESCVA